MKKEAAILGFVATFVAAFILGRVTAKKGAEDAAANNAPATESAQAADTTSAPGDSSIIPVGASYAQGGPATAPITIVEFSEFQCPFCKRVMPTMKEIKKKYGKKVRVVFKHNPLPFHKDAPYASKSALAAGEQGKFWEMHDKLFENQKKLKKADIEGYAKALGLDMAKFNKDVASKKIADQIAADQKLAKKVGARGTPNFLINGKQLSGAQPLNRFTAVIDEQLKAAEKLGKSGTKPDQIYAALVKANFKAPANKGKKKGKRGADTKTVYKIPADSGYGKGGKEPLVTIIEFSEFQCPFCKRVMPTEKKILETYKDDVRIIFKHNPLPFHKDAPLASKAALAAGEQGKFWEMHDKLFENQRKLKPDDLNGYAEALKLDMARFKADLASPKIQAAIDADKKLATQFGARGTPNFFVNGRQLSGARPFDAFKEIIDEEIKKAKKAIKAGTPRGQVYAKLTEKGLTKAKAPAPRKKSKANSKTVYKMPVFANDARKGAKEPLVTIVEFSEFQCPFCSRVLPTTSKILETYGKDVQIIFRHNPLPFHKDAPYASKAAMAAGNQGKFWEMHDVLFANNKKLKPENVEGYAKDLKLDMAKFKADIESPAFAEQIKRDQKVASQFGARGTPNFFINGRNLVGAQPFDSFKTVIEEELKKAKALMAKGTKRGDVYAKLTEKGATKAVAKAGKAPEDDKKVYDVAVNAADHFKGRKNAPITMVVFSEFQCPFCKRIKPAFDKIEEAYGDKVKVVFKHNPLSFHKDAPLASEAALAAGAQGKFWPMHDILFANQRNLKREDLEKYAQEIGLNVGKFKSDLDSGKFKAQIKADQDEARKHGARGTPTSFINGRKVRGAQPFERFKTVIDEELKKGKK